MLIAELIQAYSRQRGISLRKLAPEIGVDYLTLCRFCRGNEITGRSWVQICKWALTGPPTNAKGRKPKKETELI